MSPLGWNNKTWYQRASVSYFKMKVLLILLGIGLGPRIGNKNQFLI